MTETRKPYERGWPNGYETRDGRKVEFLKKRDDGSLIWDTGALVFSTDFTGRIPTSGIEDRALNRALDIFCTPAPVVGRLEGWANRYEDGVLNCLHSSSDAARDSRARGAIGEPVHVREVRPGDMTAEQVKALLNEFDRIGQTTTGFRAAAGMLRDASLGEA